MNRSRASINTDSVLGGVIADVKVVFDVIGRMIQSAARASMKPHASQSTRSRSGKTSKVWVGKTPNGQPPRIRTGGIANNIQLAQLESEVLIGPIALSSHDTDCLARLEFGKHPFMTPALRVVVPRLPEVWANSVSK